MLFNKMCCTEMFQIIVRKKFEMSLRMILELKTGRTRLRTNLYKYVYVPLKL